MTRRRYALSWAGADFLANACAGPFSLPDFVFGRFLVLDDRVEVPIHGGPMWIGSLLQLEQQFLPELFTARTSCFIWRAPPFLRRRTTTLAMIWSPM